MNHDMAFYVCFPLDVWQFSGGFDLQGHADLGWNWAQMSHYLCLLPSDVASLCLKSRPIKWG